MSTANYKITTLILFLLSVCIGMTAQESDGTSRREFTKEHPLVYEDAWDLWPYVFLDDNGKPTGYNVDLLTMIFDQLNIPFVIHLKPTRQALEDLRAGQSDLMLGMVARFHDDYTLYYGKNSIHLFTHSVVHPVAEEHVVRELADLSVARVIVHEGSFSHHLMQDRGWGSNAIPYGDMDKAIQMVSAEGEGQVLWNTMSLKWLIHKYHADNLMLSPVSMPSGDYRFMTNDSMLLQQIDDAYQLLKSTEQLLPLEAKWFHPENVQDDSSPAWLWYMTAGIALFCVMLAMVSLMYHLRERKATSEGRKRNARLALILRTCQVQIWTYDLAKHSFAQYADDALTTTTVSPAAVAKRYQPGDFDRLMEAIGKVAAKECDTMEVELRSADDDDQQRIFSVNLSVFRTEKGVPTVIMGTKNDITEKTLGQRKSDELMHHYMAVFNNAMVDMVYYDSQGYVNNMNDRAQLTFKTTLEEALEQRVELLTEVDRDNFDYYHATQFINTDTSRQVALPRLSAALPPNVMCYEHQLVPVYNSRHQLLGIYGTGRNVTEIAQTYHQARESVKQLKQAMQEVADHVNNINYALQVGGVRMVSYSPATHLLTINHRMHEAQYVLTQQRCLSMVDRGSEAQAMRLFRAMDRQGMTPMHCELDTNLRLPGGRQLSLQLNLFPTLGADGKVEAYTGICRDTTEMKYTERMLQQETAKAQEVEQVKNKFLHNMCSEIRTPLDTVVEYAERFENEQDAEKEETYIQVIKQNSAYLLNLINDILFLSRLDAHMVDINRQPTDFTKTVEGHCQMGWSNLQKPGVRYIVDNHYDQLVVDIDDANLGHIIEEVVKNAVEHTDQGTVRVRYDYVSDKLIIAIEDTGTGIDKASLGHVFDRFNMTPGEQRGTGLGLAICQELAIQMGGNISVSSEVGKGTIVWISIPCEASAIARKEEI